MNQAAILRQKRKEIDKNGCETHKEMKNIVSIREDLLTIDSSEPEDEFEIAFEKTFNEWASIVKVLDVNQPIPSSIIEDCYKLKSTMILGMTAFHEEL